MSMNRPSSASAPAPPPPRPTWYALRTRRASSTTSADGVKQPVHHLELTGMDDRLAVVAQVGGEAGVRLQSGRVPEDEVRGVEGVEPGRAGGEQHLAQGVQLGGAARPPAAPGSPGPGHRRRTGGQPPGRRRPRSRGPGAHARDRLDQQVEAGPGRARPPAACSSRVTSRSSRATSSAPPDLREAHAIGDGRDHHGQVVAAGTGRRAGSRARSAPGRRTPRRAGPRRPTRGPGPSPPAATASSRSRMMPSAGVATALAIRSGVLPGTKRRLRRSRPITSPSGGSRKTPSPRKRGLIDGLRPLGPHSERNAGPGTDRRRTRAQSFPGLLLGDPGEDLESRPGERGDQGLRVARLEPHAEDRLAGGARHRAHAR